MGDRRFLSWFLIAAISLGVGFRFFELDRKLVWHDEVYTSVRAAGYTRKEIDQELFQNKFVQSGSLQKFQQLKPGSSEQDTIASLIQEDPQHPPLYFLMARAWMEWFGSDRLAIRFLPALLSLLSLPLIYGLAWELFSAELEVDLIALLAVALLALSPFDILFAQTARQYSLLTATIIGSSYVLLRSLRWGIWQNWLLYLSAVTMGLYTHPFFGLTLIGQIIFVGWRRFTLLPNQVAGLRNFCLSTAGALLLYSPWILVLVVQSKRALATTDWARFDVGWLYLVKLWLLSFTSLFFDLDFGFDNAWTFRLRLPYLVLIFAAFYLVVRRTPKATWQFLLTSVLVPFLLLALPDLILGGKRSAVSRYLISCFPGVQLAIAYFLIAWQPNLLALAKPTQSFFRKLWLNAWKLKPMALAILLGGAILSCGVSAFADTWWVKDLSYYNGVVVRALPTSNYVLVSDRGDDYTNMGDLISLSYLLPQSSRLFLTKTPPDFSSLDLSSVSSQNFYLFHPSQVLKKAFEQKFGKVAKVVPETSLWRLSVTQP
jgi:uncharacterized membrane protein